MAERRQKGRTFDGAVKIARKKGYQLEIEKVSLKSMWKKRNETWTVRTQCIDVWRTNQIKPVICSVKYTWTLRNSIASKLIGIILYSRQWLHTIDIFNSYYLNNKVTCEKFDILLYATFGRPLDVQISFLSTRLQWSEKGRSMDVQFGTWTDGPNKDVQCT